MTVVKTEITMKTLSVEMERHPKKTSKVGDASAQQLYVQVKKKKIRQQYRQNQDAINFLRRFILAIVIIDVVSSIRRFNDKAKGNPLK